MSIAEVEKEVCSEWIKTSSKNSQMKGMKQMEKRNEGLIMINDNDTNETNHQYRIIIYRV